MQTDREFQDTGTTKNILKLYPASPANFAKAVENTESKCLKHITKEIEFFCNQCQQIVCSLCIFHDHNGHELTQLEEASE